MTARWSNPSGELGRHRFRVWPDATDQYNHVELAGNWDAIDEIIGVPADGSTWPPTEGEGGGIWAEVVDLQHTILPVGMMISWHRPSPAVPLPGGFAVCDGGSVSEANHDFGIAGPVTLPDMRNRFVLGADATKTIGQAGVSATHGDIESAAGAPGPQGLGGSNTHTLTVAQMAAHKHSGSKTGWSPLALHWYTEQGLAQTYGAETEKWGPGNATGTGVGGWQPGQHRHLMNSLTSVGSSEPHENRPAYVGLIWICKVKNVG